MTIPTTHATLTTSVVPTAPFDPCTFMRPRAPRRARRSWLPAPSPPPPPRVTWSGAGANNQWTTRRELAGRRRPGRGRRPDRFRSAALQTTNVNNFPAGTTFGSITFVAAYTLGGNALTLTGTHRGHIGRVAHDHARHAHGDRLRSRSESCNVVGPARRSNSAARSPARAGLTKVGGGTLRIIGTVVQHLHRPHHASTKARSCSGACRRQSPSPPGLTVGNTNGGASADVVRLENLGPDRGRDHRHAAPAGSTSRTRTRP